MSKLVTVSPSPLRVKTFTFLWTIDNFSQIITGVRSTLNPGYDSNVNMPKWSVTVKLFVQEKRNLNLVICPLYTADQVILTHMKVSAVNNKKEKIQIFEKNRVIEPNYDIRPDIEKSFILCDENGFLTQDKLMLVFEVDCVYESKDNEVQSSAGVSLQDSPNHLRSGFTQLFESKQCSDVTLNVGDYTVKAHKAILIASSPVFAAMFQHDMQEQNLNCIAIPDIDPEVLEEMLRYIYTDDIPNLDAMADHLLKAADKYAIPKLKFKCEESLQANISIENAAYTLMLADRYNAELLKAKTLDYITANASEVVETQDWEEMIKSGNNVHVLGEAFRALALKPKFI